MGGGYVALTQKGYKIMLPNIEQLAKGQFGDYKTVIKNCAAKRSFNRVTNHGKTKYGRLIAEIPLAVFLNPEFRRTYLNTGMKREDRNKEWGKFLKRDDMRGYLTVDKL